MPQTETKASERTEKQTVNDQHAKLTPDAPLKTNKQMGAEWDAAFSSAGAHDYSKVSAELKAGALAAYARGGSFALSHFQDDVNQNVKAAGAGPIFVLNNNKIEIHNVQGLKSEKWQALPANEQAQYKKLISVSGAMGHNKELSPPLIFDAPDNIGLNLKPGQKVSAEFPSEYVVAAAFKSGDMLNKNWVGQNPEQKFLIDRLKPAADELAVIPSGIIDAKASTGDVTPVNNFLHDKGFDIKLDQIGPKEVAFAGTLNLKGAWSGKESTVHGADGINYPAAMVHDIKTFTKDGVAVAQLYDKDGLTVYAALVGSDKLSSYQVTARAASLTPTSHDEMAVFQLALIPKVNKDLSSDLTGLIGMTALDGTRISQAKMQTKLAIDENGFTAQQGLGVATSRGIGEPTPDITFDKPFIVWAVQKGCTQPLFATEVDQKYWKDPKRSK